jgi:hypothetical protein
MAPAFHGRSGATGTPAELRRLGIVTRSSFLRFRSAM